MTEEEIRRELAVIGRTLENNTKAVNDLTIVILGKDGQGGCLRNHGQLAKDFYNFRLLSVMIFCSAGIFGGGGFWLSKVVGG